LVLVLIRFITEEEVWSTSDVTKKELIEFLESMNSSQFKDIEKFFETMPKLSHTIKVKNPKTEVESEVVLEGLASFFA
jgi:DNA-directed RNA polymerase specialized sigma subunit